MVDIGYAHKIFAMMAKILKKLSNMNLMCFLSANTIWCDLGYSQLWTVQMLDGVTNSVSVHTPGLILSKAKCLFGITSTALQIILVFLLNSLNEL